MRSVSSPLGNTKRSRNGARRSCASSRSARPRANAPEPPSTPPDHTIPTMLPIRSTVAGRTRAARCLATVLTEVELAAPEQLGEAEGDAFIARIEQVWLDFYEAMEMLYGPERADADLDQLAGDLLKLALQDRTRASPGAARARSAPRDRRAVVSARSHDRLRRLHRPVRHVLAGVRDRLDYLAELGVTYLHLMPLLKPRDGENDGGYAVADYRSVDPRLGTMADLERARDRPAWARHEPVRRLRAQSHGRHARVGRGAPRLGTRRAAATTSCFLTGRCRMRTSARCPRSFRTWRRAASPGCRRWTPGSGRRSTSTSGT